jgi:Calx-beta domain-containing protein
MRTFVKELSDSYIYTRQFISDLKWKHILVLLGLCFLSSTAVSGQYFTLPGYHPYALNSSTQVFDISPDAKIGISLRNDPVSVHPALLTTFDPILGTQMDSKTFGFGPLGVALAQVGSSLRAVVLTSEGGPRRIYLFDVSSTGQLTQLASTQLTTSNSDGGSNLVLSGSAQAGFVVVYSNSGADLVAFSLLDGAILNRLALSGITSTLAMKETSTSRVLALRLGNSLTIVNALNPSQMTLAGSVPLLSNGEFSGSSYDGLAFSTDGRFVFLGNQFYNFAAIDLNLMQVVGTIPGANYRFSRVRIFESNQQRLLAVLSSPSGTTGVTAILLVDATDPSHLSIVNQYTPLSTESFFTKSDFAFSHDGARLYAAPKEKLIAFDLPGFNKAWEQPVPGSVLQVHQLRVYGPSDEIFGAWDTNVGLGFTGIFGAFPAFPPDVAINQSTTVGEGDSGGQANFTISLSSSAAPHQVIVKYATADGTATKGSDYTNTNGTVTFAPGVTTKIVSVPIVNDAADEFDETFTLNIQSATPGIVTRAQSTATILDDDPTPSVSINDVSVTEGNSGTRNATFLASLSAASGKPITLTYATANGTATSGDDYVSASGTISFSPGQTTSAIVIQVKGDTLSEDDKTFVVNLSNPVNVTITDGQGVGTIVDNDSPILATEQDSQRAIALESVTFVRDPFAVTNPNSLGTDHRTRIILFTTNLIVAPGLVVTAQAVDSQQTTYQLPVEFVGSLPQFLGFAQIIVKLPDGIMVAGDLQVSITARGRTSNKVLVGVVP